jgi:hypothetical protein
MTAEPARRTKSSSMAWSAIVLVAFFAIHVAIHWRAGTFRSEFGRYQDEGMHYVTGLAVRDFVTTPAEWRHPMAFGLRYYAHFPKVALGNWPPAFPLLQTIWSVIFGVSRLSLLLEMALLTAVLALIVTQACLSRTGALFAFLAGVLLVASPITQYVSSMIMAEIPLALFSLLGVLAWIRFAESEQGRDALLMGVWIVAAIMTKGNGWVVPIVVAGSIVMTGSWRHLRRGHLWLAALLVAVVCLPFTVLTMKIVARGWNTSTVQGFPAVMASLAAHARFAVQVLGLPLTAIVLVGLLGRVIVPLIRRERVEPFWSVLALYVATVIIFHGVVPTSFEPRKVYQLAPALCMFAAAGLEYLVRLLARHRASNELRAGVGVAAAVTFFASGFSLLPPFAPGFAQAINIVLAQPDTDHTAVLVASNPVFKDSEAAIIAEWASRRPHTGTYLIRGTKFLSHPVTAADETAFAPYVTTPQEVHSRMAGVPVAYVILHTTTAAESYPHHELLREMLTRYPDDWELIHSSRRIALGQPHDIAVYRCRRDLRGVPIRFQFDLIQNIRIEVGSEAPASGR